MFTLTKLDGQLYIYIYIYMLKIIYMLKKLLTLTKY